MSERSDAPSPVTDSPWFWLLLFSGMALAMLIVMGPKYQRRQANIEQKYEGFQHSTHGPSDRSAEPAEPPQDRLLIISLRPLMILMGTLVIVSGAALYLAAPARRKSLSMTIS